MPEAITIALFCLVLAVCTICGFPLLAGLGIGLALFCGYALLKGHKPKEVGKMLRTGIKTGSGVLIMFALIGLLTGLWRASGTISLSVSLAAHLFTPETLVLASFASCAAVSFLIGTCFGTAATMGVVCMTVGQSIGVDAALMGGAIISGSFFGDRCSPISSSAFLVAELTGTTVRKNIPRMLKTAAVPTLICVVAYLCLGLPYSSPINSEAVAASISQGFSTSLVCLAPAALVLLLPLVMRNARLTMLIGCIAAAIICFTVQQTDPAAVLKAMILGFTPVEGQAAQLAGGGLVSMAYAAAVVCISSSFAGIFRGTGMLKGIQALLAKLAKRITNFGALVVTSAATSCIACNQTLAVMLAAQLYGPLQKNNAAFANELEDSAIVMAGLVPWSIAVLVPLTCANAPIESIPFAFFLYAVPLCHWAWDAVKFCVPTHESKAGSQPRRKPNNQSQAPISITAAAKSGSSSLPPGPRADQHKRKDPQPIPEGQPAQT